MIFATQELIALRVLLKYKDLIVQQVITVQKVQQLLHHVRLVLITLSLEVLVFLIAKIALEDILVQDTAWTI